MILFAWPWVFLALPLPWLLRRLLRGRTERTPAVRVPFGDRLTAAAARGPATQRAARHLPTLVAEFAVWTLLLTALARPQRLGEPVSRVVPTRDLLLLVDLSASMTEEDFADPDDPSRRVDRLTAVKSVAGDFLERREGDRVGLVVFGNAPFLQAPFSTDLAMVRALLDEAQVGMAGPKTAFGDAIGLGIHLFEDSDTPAKTIVAMTDGNDTASRVPPVEAARVAADRDIRVHTIAIGDPSAAGEQPLDEAALRDVADAAGGTYSFAADTASLEAVYAELDRVETREVVRESRRPRRELYAWPLVLALLASLARRAARRAARGGGAAIDAGTTIRIDPVRGTPRVESIDSYDADSNRGYASPQGGATARRGAGREGAA